MESISHIKWFLEVFGDNKMTSYNNLGSIQPYLRATSYAENLETRVKDEELIERPKLHYGVLLVDMQAHFLQYVTREKQEKMIPAQIDVLRFCAKYDLPVAIIEWQWGGETIPELGTNVKNIPRHYNISKNHPNGLTNQNLALLLNKWGVTSVCLMGAYASGCVRSTAEGALKNGFKIMTADQLIASFNGQGREAYKSWFSENGMFFPEYQHLLEVERR